MKANALDVRGLSVSYRGHEVLQEVGLTLPTGKCLGLVGESGSGKSTLARAVLGLQPADAGEVSLFGEPLFSLRPAARARVLRRVQMVFQSPSSSFNPRRDLRWSVSEPLRCNPEARLRLCPGGQLDEYLEELMRTVRLDPALLDSYRRELSGGQLQRMAIARALSTRPGLIILDEPTSSLDVSVQASVLNLLKDLQEAHQMSYLFITHDLGVVRFMADDIAVLREGRIVDAFPAGELLSPARDEYTKNLVAAFM